jgi:HEXXH motif-containing protein
VALSCPGARNLAAMTAETLAANVQDHLVGFLRRRGKDVAARSRGLVSRLDTLCNEELAWDAGLAFPTRAILASLAGSEGDSVWVAALIAGHFHSSARVGAWSAEVLEPRSLRFGRLVTPKVLAVSVEGDAVDYRTAAGTTRTTFSRAEGLRPLGAVPIDARRAFWVAGADDREALSLDDAKELASAPVMRRVQSLEAAVEILRAHAPEYLEWCGDAVRVVASWAGHPEAMMSGSMPGHQGVIYCSSPLHPIRIAEALVHEASHQYFQIGEMRTRFHIAEDDSLYWSPYVKKERPIERILLAYHAFANVTLFYERVLAATRCEEEKSMAMRSLAQHRPNLVAFAAYLDHSAGLTPAGRALYRTVCAKVAP